MSISQGSSKFELEEFAGDAGQLIISPTTSENSGAAARPQTSGAARNWNQLGVPPATVPATTLGAMRGAAGKKGGHPGRDRGQRPYLRCTQTRDLPKGPGSTPESKRLQESQVEGSGGGFLSNDSSTETACFRPRLDEVPMIHMTHLRCRRALSTQAKRLYRYARKILRALCPISETEGVPGIL